MNDARELIAMRTTIHAALDPEDIPRINFRALVNAAADALARGWTGDEIARHAVEGIYTGEVRELGALMLANIRPLADVAPPREVTPQPPAAADVLAGIHARHQPADATQWIERIRAQHADRRRAAR